MLAAAAARVVSIFDRVLRLDRVWGSSCEWLCTLSSWLCCTYPYSGTDSLYSRSSLYCSDLPLRILISPPALYLVGIGTSTKYNEEVNVTARSVYYVYVKTTSHCLSNLAYFSNRSRSVLEKCASSRFIWIIFLSKVSWSVLWIKDFAGWICC